ncbi:MAG: 3-hydroxybutyrate dehydrogenase [Alphaproteobacteria bacterium]|nr:3-hydroxybutyrate dehydrogenase [Alphaproteobacteria bacterium]
MLNGKVAVVSGSTSGIGLAIARALAGQGADILLNGFGDAAGIESIRDCITAEFGVRTVYDPADMSRPDEAAGLVRAARDGLGGCDILVNNAGIQHTAPIEDFPAEHWDAIIALNLSQAFHTIRTAIPMMYENGWGRIVNIASVHGRVASINKAAYVSAKHGLVGLTKVVALEAAGRGVTCNAICPGWVLTPLIQKQIDIRAAEKELSAEAATIDLLAEKQPSRQFATPEQVGALAAFLCLPAAEQITGQALGIDGGWTAQ